MELGRARRHDQTVEVVLLDVVLHLLLGGIGAGEHRGFGHDDAGLAPGGGSDGLDIDVIGNIAAAVADIHADPAFALGHAGTFALSR